MKLLRYGPSGREKPGMLDAAGNIRDLSGVIVQIDDRTIAPRELAKLRKIKPESLPLVNGNPRLGVPYAGISKFVAVGLNYSDHAAESNMPIPAEPILFMKATTSLSGPNDDVIQPKGSTKLDWEVELGIVIGTKAQYVAEDRALDYVAGYCVINDISERNFQLERGRRKRADARDGGQHLGARLCRVLTGISGELLSTRSVPASSGDTSWGEWRIGRVIPLGRWRKSPARRRLGDQPHRS